MGGSLLCFSTFLKEKKQFTNGWGCVYGAHPLHTDHSQIDMYIFTLTCPYPTLEIDGACGLLGVGAF